MLLRGARVVAILWLTISRSQLSIAVNEAATHKFPLELHVVPRLPYNVAIRHRSGGLSEKRADVIRLIFDMKSRIADNHEKGQSYNTVSVSTFSGENRLQLRLRFLKSAELNPKILDSALTVVAAHLQPSSNPADAPPPRPAGAHLRSAGAPDPLTAAPTQPPDDAFDVKIRGFRFLIFGATTETPPQRIDYAIGRFDVWENDLRPDDIDLLVSWLIEND